MSDIFDTPPTPQRIKLETDRLAKRIRELHTEREHLIRSLRFFQDACLHEYSTTNKYDCLICGHNNE